MVFQAASMGKTPPWGEQKLTTSQPRRPSCMDMGFALLGNPGVSREFLGQNSGKKRGLFFAMHGWSMALSIRIDHIQQRYGWSWFLIIQIWVNELAMFGESVFPAPIKVSQSLPLLDENRGVSSYFSQPIHGMWNILGWSFLEKPGRSSNWGLTGVVSYGNGSKLYTTLHNFFFRSILDTKNDQFRSVGILLLSQLFACWTMRFLQLKSGWTALWWPNYRYFQEISQKLNDVQGLASLGVSR